MGTHRWVILKFLLITELGAYAYFYLKGYQGFFAQKEVIKQASVIEKKINIIQNEIEDLHSKIVLFKSEPYYKEKIAREKLHMSFPYDTIYYITYNKGNK